MWREIDSTVALILTELSQEQQEKVEQYIESLLNEIHDLESEVEDLEEQQRDCDFCESNYKGTNHPIAQVVQEIVDDNYYHTSKSYDTRDKIIKRLEHALRYECERS